VGPHQEEGRAPAGARREARPVLLQSQWYLHVRWALDCLHRLMAAHPRRADWQARTWAQVGDHRAARGSSCPSARLAGVRSREAVVHQGTRQGREATCLGAWAAFQAFRGEGSPEAACLGVAYLERLGRPVGRADVAGREVQRLVGSWGSRVEVGWFQRRKDRRSV